MVKFVAIIDANNFPVYFYTKNGEDETQNHFLGEMALDFIDSQFARSATSSGLLIVHDGVAIYGNISNTNIKVFIGVDSHSTDDTDLDSIFKAIQDSYVQHICNPFYNHDKKIISSKTFDEKIEKILS